MSIEAILLPLFVQVLLTFALMFGMMYYRTNALRSGETRLSEIAMREPNWPTRATQFAYAFSNQFELPVLFYVLAALALATCQARATLVILSWIFVASRLAHVFIHTTSNNVPRRFWAYCVGLATLMLMWALFAVDIVAGR